MENIQDKINNQIKVTVQIPDKPKNPQYTINQIYDILAPRSITEGVAKIK